MRSQTRQAASILGAAVLSVAFAAALPQSASAQPAPTRQSARTHPAAGTRHVQRMCATPTRPGVMACFALRRTDSLHQKVGPGILPSGYGPADIQSAYGLAAGNGAGRVVAIVDAYDDPNAESDLATYRSTYGLPACTTANGCFTKVNQNGVQGAYPPADSGWAGEISLDVDMVSAACPTCHILLVEANSPTIANLGTSVNTAVALGAKYVSNSYGGGESSGESSYDSSYYHHPGVAVTASTGDNGYGVSYPAASPYVTSVGGTSLTHSGNLRGWAESAWGGAGSGCSAYEAKPAYQNVNTGCAHRAVADVSAVADPNTGLAVYQTYGGTGWAVYGGTSASSPIIASVYALAGVPGAGDTPAAYPYAHPANLWDVTTGANGSCAMTQQCHAGPGWDGPTGLGTPNGTAAFKAGVLPRVGLVDSSGSLYVKQGALTGGWTLEKGDVQSFALSGDRIGVVTSAHELWVKEGALNAHWTLESSNAQSLALSGDRIGMIDTSHQLWVKEGPLAASWSFQSSDAQSLAMSGDRVGVVNSAHQLAVKEGDLTASWVVESPDAQSFALTGTRIGVVNSARQLNVKEGSLSAAWHLELGDVSATALAGNRIGAVTSAHRLSVKDGALNAHWTVESSDAQFFALAGNRIGVIDSTHRLSVKEGSLTAAWTIVSNDAQTVSLSDGS